MGLSLRTVLAGALLSLPLGAIPASAQIQNNATALEINQLDPKMEKQIIEARRIIADMRARGVSEKEVNQEVQKLTREIVGETEETILFRGKPMPLLAAVILLITGFGMMAINKRDRERAGLQETNSHQPELNLPSSLN